MKRSITVCKKTIILTALLVAGTSHLIWGQSRHMTPVNLGTGGGGTAFLDSYHANFVNPANLMLNEGTKPRLSIGLMGGLSTSVGGSLLNVGVYNDYFTTGQTVAGPVADNALNDWFGTNPENMRRASFQLDVIPIGGAYRSEKWAASLALRARTLFDMEMNRGLAQLGIYGLDGDVFSEDTPINLNLSALSFYEVSAGYSMKLLELPELFGVFRNVTIYAGGAPKLLLGANLTRLTFASQFRMEGESRNNIDLIRHDFRYEFETTGELADQLTEFHNARQQQDEVPDISDFADPPAEDGFGIKSVGLGLDLGATAEMELDLPFAGNFFKGPEQLRIGFSITDLGRVSFKDQIGKFVADDVMEWRGFKLDQERIDNEFNGSRSDYLEYVLQDSIGTDIYGSFAPDEVSSVSSSLPTMVNLGGQLIMNKLSVSMDFGKGFAEVGPNSKRVSVATGAEYRFFGFLPLRVGMRVGGYSSTAYSVGFGLEFRNFEFSLAANTVNRSINSGTHAGVAWSGLVFRF